MLQFGGQLGDRSATAGNSFLGSFNFGRQQQQQSQGQATRPAGGFGQDRSSTTVITLFGFPIQQWETIKASLLRTLGHFTEVEVSWSHVRIAFENPITAKQCLDLNGQVVEDYIIGASTLVPQLRNEDPTQFGSQAIAKSNNVAPEEASAALKIAGRLGIPADYSKSHLAKILSIIFDF